MKKLRLGDVLIFINMVIIEVLGISLIFTRFSNLKLYNLTIVLIFIFIAIEMFLFYLEGSAK